MTFKKNFAILLAALCALSACGVKPSNINPPEEMQNHKFPRTYPDIDTDPAPYIPPTVK